MSGMPTRTYSYAARAWNADFHESPSQKPQYEAPRARQTSTYLFAVILGTRYPSIQAVLLYSLCPCLFAETTGYVPVDAVVLRQSDPLVGTLRTGDFDPVLPFGCL